MRTTSIAAAGWATLVAVAAWGLFAPGHASAQNGYVNYNYANGAMLVAGTEYAPAPGGPNGACAGPAAQPYGACQGQAAAGCPTCATCPSSGCGGCSPHRRTLMESGYWDGRSMCGECPYGMDQYGRCSDPRWEVTGAAMFMSRSGARKGILVGDILGTSLVSTTDLKLDWPVGPRVSLVRRSENIDFEFIYWGIDDWDSSHSLVGDNSLVVPVAGLDPYVFGSVQVDYQSRLYNAESNMKIRVGEAANFLIGGRIMELHDRLILDAQPGSQSIVEANVWTKAANFLYGLQIGADTDVPAWFGIKFNLFIKAGVFGNHLRESWVRDTTLSYDAQCFRDKKTAFVGETGVTATWQFNKNLGVFAGYEWMFIDGVLLAPDMITQTTVRTNTPTYEGAMCGVNFQW